MLGGITRRKVLSLATAGSVALPSIYAQGSFDDAVITGEAIPALKSFDELMTSFVAQYEVPGASLAVTKQGKLVYARGFGYADLENKIPVQPSDLFRIASISKPITAVAVMQLIQQGKLGLDEKVFNRLRLRPVVSPGTRPDARWNNITVRHCLNHTGGWDREVSYDPIGKAKFLIEEFGVRPPVTPNHLLQYMMGQPLDFDPGQRYAYSNLGYLVLGRLIEVVSRQSYEAYVKRNVLKPLGIQSMRLGRALVEHRAKGEVLYYDRKNRVGTAIYPPRVGQQVPIQYGFNNLEGYQAHGGWIASTADLVKFASAFDDPANCPILGEQAIKEMWDRPVGAAGQDQDGAPSAAFYGCGWSVRPVGADGKSNRWHAGKIAGSEGLLVCRHDGLNWAVLFNTDSTIEGPSLVSKIDSPLHQAADAVKQWPDIDRFAQFLSS